MDKSLKFLIVFISFLIALSFLFIFIEENTTEQFLLLGYALTLGILLIFHDDFSKPKNFKFIDYDEDLKLITLSYKTLFNSHEEKFLFRIRKEKRYVEYVGFRTFEEGYWIDSYGRVLNKKESEKISNLLMFSLAEAKMTEKILKDFDPLEEKVKKLENKKIRLKDTSDRTCYELEEGKFKTIRE